MITSLSSFSSRKIMPFTIVHENYTFLYEVVETKPHIGRYGGESESGPPHKPFSPRVGLGRETITVRDETSFGWVQGTLPSERHGIVPHLHLKEL